MLGRQAKNVQSKERCALGRTGEALEWWAVPTGGLGPSQLFQATVVTLMVSHKNIKHLI